MSSLRHELRAFAAEFFGTFALVFAGTCAIVANDASGGAITHVGISLTFGLTVLAMIFALGDVSGAHLNPAVSLGFFAARRLPGGKAVGYVLSQTAGALAASGLLRWIYPAHETLGATLPSVAVPQAFVLEVILTCVLMLVILAVSTGSKEKGMFAGIAVGAVVALEALFAGPVTGASMNPARSLAPALVSGQLSSLWVYLAAPALGALLAVPACWCTQAPGCCPPVTEGEPAGG